MKNTLIGVISYLPNTKHRQVRLESATKLLERLKSEFPDTEILCVAQCYKESEYIDGVHYLRFDHGIGCGGARNELYKYFYKSDYDWLLFMDDDCFIKDYYDALDLIRILDEDPKATPLDLITSVSPRVCGFKKGNIMNREVVENYFTFKNISRQVPVGFFRNIKKYYNKEIYANTEQDIHGRYLAEDFLWTKDLVAAGMKLRTCQQWIQDNCGMTYSIIIDEASDKQNEQWHLDIFEDTKKYFIKQYGLPEKGFYNAFNKKYNVLKGVDDTMFNIPRRKRHEFTELELHYIPRKPKAKKVEETTETAE